jgi:hypothetical protein
MSDITETEHPTAEGQSNNQGAGTGAVTPAANTEERTFTQAQVDEIVKGRLAEERNKLGSKHTKELETKIAEAVAARETEFEAQVAERIKAALAERDLTDARRSLQAEYGLTDAQLARLTGDTADDLKADAETLFGALKQRKPPVLVPGTQPTPETPLDISKLTPAQIREMTPELLKRLGS